MSTAKNKRNKRNRLIRREQLARHRQKTGKLTITVNAVDNASPALSRLEALLDKKLTAAEGMLNHFTERYARDDWRAYSFPRINVNTKSTPQAAADYTYIDEQATITVEKFRLLRDRINVSKGRPNDGIIDVEYTDVTPKPKALQPGETDGELAKLNEL